jgi:putative aldouronate transport system substrate-binding protein
MIKGELDIEKDWDAYVADWMKLGGEQLTKEANDWYKSK